MQKLHQPSSLYLTTTYIYTLYLMLFVIFLLYKSYSLHQIQFRTGLGKFTIKRIKKKMNKNKKNNKKGPFFKAFFL